MPKNKDFPTPTPIPTQTPTPKPTPANAIKKSYGFIGPLNDDIIGYFYWNTEDTIKQLKYEIYEKYNIPVKRQRILFNGEEEKDENKKVIDCDCKNFSLKYNPPSNDEDYTTIKIYDKRQYNLKGYEEPGYFYVKLDLCGDILKQIREYKKYLGDGIYLFKDHEMLYFNQEGLLLLSQGLKIENYMEFYLFEFNYNNTG